MMTEGLMHSLWLASALLLIMEGIMPFLSPSAFRETLLKMANLSDRTLRMIGFFSMIVGVILLYWVN